MQVREHGKIHRFTACGMRKGNPVRPEGNITFFVSAAVFAVAEKGHSAGRKLRPDLMRAPGEQSDQHK